MRFSWQPVTNGIDRNFRLGGYSAGGLGIGSPLVGSRGEAKVEGWEFNIYWCQRGGHSICNACSLVPGLHKWWICKTVELHVKSDYFEIISLFYFTCNHVWNWNKIILAAEIISKLSQPHFVGVKKLLVRYAVHNGQSRSMSGGW